MAEQAQVREGRRHTDGTSVRSVLRCIAQELTSRAQISLAGTTYTVCRSRVVYNTSPVASNLVSLDSIHSINGSATEPMNYPGTPLRQLKGGNQGSGSLHLNGYVRPPVSNYSPGTPLRHLVSQRLRNPRKYWTYFLQVVDGEKVIKCSAFRKKNEAYAKLRSVVLDPEYMMLQQAVILCELITSDNIKEHIKLIGFYPQETDLQNEVL